MVRVMLTIKLTNNKIYIYKLMVYSDTMCVELTVTRLIQKKRQLKNTVRINSDQAYLEKKRQLKNTVRINSDQAYLEKKAVRKYSQN